MQTSFNLVHQSKERGMGIIAKRPIASGAWGVAAIPGNTERIF